MPNANFVVLFQKLISTDKGKFISLFQATKLCPFLAKKTLLEWEVAKDAGTRRYVLEVYTFISFVRTPPGVELLK